METQPAQGFAGPGGADALLIRMWLHGKSANTAAAYRRDVAAFLAHAGVPLDQVQLVHLQAWDASMANDARSSRARRLSSVRSLLGFMTAEGLLARNPGAGLKVEKATETLGERILSEADTVRLVATETCPRRRALLRLIYVCGLRASEAASLRGRDLSGSEKRGGEARVLGKGGKLRVVEVPASLWRELMALHPAGLAPDAPLIPGRRAGSALDRKAVHRAVKRAVRHAGVNPQASAHWLRHCHVTHALENGAKIHVVQQAVGHASLATTSKYAHVRPGEGSASFIRG